MKELVLLFLRMGLLGFGGPIAVMGMLEEEVCQKRRWISPEKYAQMYAILKLAPGPLSTQMVIYLGNLRAGALGGIVAGVSFILPSFLIVLVLSYFYLNAHLMKELSHFFPGMQAGALVVILLSTWQLGKPYRKIPSAWAIAALSAVCILYFPHWEPVVILIFGILGLMVTFFGNIGDIGNVSPKTMAQNNARSALALDDQNSKNLLMLSWLGMPAGFSSFYLMLGNSVFFHLFRVCFEAGAFVFGTGLAIVPVLEGEVVRHYHWLSHSQFMDGLAMGQITPGPVVITATFIGFKVAGFLGALVATVSIFLPSFINVLIILPRLFKWLTKTTLATTFIRWAIPSVVGGIIGSTMRLGWLTLTTPLLVGIFIVGLLMAIKFRPPGWVLIPLSGFLAGVFNNG